MPEQPTDKPRNKGGRPRKIDLEEAVNDQPEFGGAALTAEAWAEKMRGVKRLVTKARSLRSDHFEAMINARNAAIGLFEIGMRVTQCGRYPKGGAVVGFEQKWSDVPCVFVQWDNAKAGSSPVRVCIPNIKPEEKTDA